MTRFIGLLVLAALVACTATTPVPQNEQRSESQLLAAEPNVPFPDIAPYEPVFPEPRRIFHVDNAAAPPGDGSAERPWTDLQAALCRLQPGDRLVVAPRNYTGPFRIGGNCRDGTPDAPIQLVARDVFLVPGTSGDVLTIERAHWQLRNVQIALRDSAAAGLVVTGRHIAVDHSHISEGDGPAIRVAGGAADVVVSNGHIHHSGGIRIERGATRVQLRNNKIHHNRSSGVTVAGAREVTIEGNRVYNDSGPAIDLSAAAAVTLARNRLWNGVPSAVRLRDGSTDVTIEQNAIVEATTAIDVAGAERVAIRRNYFENRLTGGSTVVLVAGSRDVRFDDNTVTGYEQAERRR